ncbi:MAG: hypothetical protein CMN34_03275 [Saprospirales bacterium]|nr:hypothetical protein [Saprospirales bacterium]|tara:strand:+ start:1390 stop:2541 length:1152 start_codon:yes stop_codon:yes gene_type:complete
MGNASLQYKDLSVCVISVQDFTSNHCDLVADMLPFQEVDYLTHLAQSNPAIEHFVCAVYDGDTLLARAYLQRMLFRGERLDSFRPNRWLAQKLYDIIVRPIRWRVLSLGSIFTTGDNGLVFSKELSQEAKEEVYGYFLYQLQNGLIPYDGLLIKDVYMATDSWMIDSLRKRGFYMTPSEPDMILENVTRFSTMEKYAAALRAKYRTKYNQVAERSKDLRVDDYSNWGEAPTETMFPLYVNIMSAVDFYIQLMSPAYFQIDGNSSSSLPKLRTYSVDGQVIGWISWFESANRIHAHLIGLNHKRAGRYKAYHRILYDLVELGIQHKKDTVCFGRTSQQAKSNVGAKPNAMASAVYHRRKPMRYLIKSFAQSVVLDTENLRQAFR